MADAAVFGRPDPRSGEAPAAAVVAHGGVDPAEVMAYVNERVAPYSASARCAVRRGSGDACGEDPCRALANPPATAGPRP
ncbi:MAG: hypothetical protein JO179_18295 [Solirubrobacterales bacterium]|nr:hypothetical protein [Solirubrobacterales bacterium]